MMKVKSTAGIILAAGASTRLGEPKQLLRLKDKCLIEWVLKAALDSKLDRIVLVLGYAQHQILQALGEKSQHSKLLVAINPQYKKGQGSSLHIGLSKVKDDYPAVMFLLGDQPMLTSAVINTLLENFWATDKHICFPTYRNRRKTPAIFSRCFYEHLMKIKGDIGARQLIKENRDDVFTVEIDNPLFFCDIDTRQDFEKLKRKLEQS